MIAARPSPKGSPVRLPTLLITAAACALTLAHCSHDSNTLTVSPPLPPAEEPPDDAPGAYISDAGAIPGESDRQKNEGPRGSGSESPPGATPRN